MGQIVHLSDSSAAARQCTPRTLPPIDTAGRVHVTGPTRRQVFAHKGIAEGRGPLSIVGVVHSPPGYLSGSSGRDWSICVGADEVSFAPTGLGAEVYPNAVDRAASP